MKEQPEIGYLQADKLMTFAEKDMDAGATVGSLGAEPLPLPWHIFQAIERLNRSLHAPSSF